MMKKLCSLFLACLIAICSMQNVAAYPQISMSAKYAIAIDREDGNILYAKNEHKKMYPASITKILTCIVAIEKIDDFDKTVTIQKRDLDTIWETGATAANFIEGEVVTYWDLLMGAMLPSGADACRALAFNLSGSQEAFVEEMNNFCTQKLKLTDSHFVNTTGIHDKNHYTTVYDMARVTQYALKNEKFKEVFERYQYNCSNGLHQWVKRVLYRAKRAGVDVSMIKGCKSGYTSDSKHTLSSLVDVDGREIITVVGQSENTENYNYCTVNDTKALANYVSRNYKEVTLFEAGAEVKKSKIKHGEESIIQSYLDKGIDLYLPIDYEKDDVRYVATVNELEAPVKKDQVIGKIQVYYQDELLETKPLKALKAVEEKAIRIKIGNFFNWLLPWGIVKIIVGFIILLLSVRYVIIKCRRARKRRRMRKMRNRR